MVMVGAPRYSRDPMAHMLCVGCSRMHPSGSMARVGGRVMVGGAASAVALPLWFCDWLCCDNSHLFVDGQNPKVRAKGLDFSGELEASQVNSLCVTVKTVALQLL
eukprot:CAMPEP_0198118086 /NCGR_PEP_ID=MMETSP1442-20131203/20341_1 /TAXON_ID= /ORGANISM="Craspedostauros australis, Strain CCMP3328" /LENGTH=104 /DNA_ID=CAMNT_0043776279 /DNA_START=399 /DNA_END=710 /DNA_ORIENTATION=+